MISMTQTLHDLGWSPFFLQQLDLDELESTSPARVTAVERGRYTLLGEDGEIMLDATTAFHRAFPDGPPTVGDWVLLDRESGQPVRLLDRTSLFRRKGVGGAAEQRIAANVDTLFVVTSCNYDFNPSRIERFLALAHDADVEPVIILTKSDMADDVSDYVEQARILGRNLSVVPVNAKDPASVEALEPWCAPGKTVALLGSSGVGKSTLLNTLAGRDIQLTGEIREADSKGRHTTTTRSLHRLESGLLVVDTPGIRELQIFDCEEGLTSLFDDIVSLEADCRFSNCTHTAEPGCAVLAAVEQGTLDPRRLKNYLKLISEQARNAESVAQRRQRQRSFSKIVKTAVGTKKRSRH